MRVMNHIEALSTVVSLSHFLCILIGDINFTDITEEGQDFAALTALPFLMTTSNVTSKKNIKEASMATIKTGGI